MKINMLIGKVRMMKTMLLTISIIVMLMWDFLMHNVVPDMLLLFFEALIRKHIINALHIMIMIDGKPE